MKSTSKRHIGIDFLRFVAVFLVLGRHMPPLPDQNNYLLNIITEAWLRGGWIGVDIFFVLSGFLVSGLLFREYNSNQKIDAKRFLIRRGFKIYPPFYLLIFTTIAYKLFFSEEIKTKHLLGELFFLQNYLGGIWNHTWSLAVEEHFYILLCFLLLFLTNSRFKFLGKRFENLPYIFLLVLAFCLSWRLIIAYRFPYKNLTHLYPTHMRVDSLFLGSVVAYYFHLKKEIFLSLNQKIGKILPVFIGLSLLSPAFIWNLDKTWWISSIGVLSFSIGSGLLLIAFLQFDFSNNFFLRFLAFLGCYSYSIYLWHMPVREWLVPGIENYLKVEFTWELFMLIYILGSFMVGTLMAKIVEVPVLKFRDRLFPPKSKAL